MYARILKPPKLQSFFLFGPRGTGKSSWTKAQFPESNVVDLLEGDVYTDLLAQPTRLSRYLTNKSSPVIIDEIQKVPPLLDEVHRLIEKEDLQFILTGSSARKLRRTGVNLLAGRAFTLSMFPLTAQELGPDFNLKQAMEFGLLPSIYGKKHLDFSKYLKSYVQTYLREEVFQEGLTRNLPAFSRFLEAASFSQGAVLNLSAVAADCSVPRKTVESYFGLLDDLLLGCRIPPFSKRAKRETVAHSKFYFFDAGVFRAIRPKGPLDSPDEISGMALETLVFQELRALNSYLDLGYEVSFWRTQTHLEVDFVLYGEKGLRVFEVKKGSRFRTEDLRGLREFLKDYPIAKAHLLYGGDRMFQEDGIQIIPLKDFFKSALDWIG